LGKVKISLWMELISFGSGKISVMDTRLEDKPTIITGYRWLAFLILSLLPLFIGGARPWLWSWAAVSCLLAMIPGLWIIGPPSLFPRSPLFWIALGPLLAWTLFLTLPLPEGILTVLSPHRADLARTASNLLALPYNGAPLSYDPQVGLLYWGLLVSVSAFGLIVRQVALRPGGLQGIIRIFWVVALFQAGYGLFQVLIPSLGVLWAEPELSHISAGRARGSLINCDHYAFFLNMLWPVCLAYALSAKKVGGRSSRIGNPRISGQREDRSESMARRALQFFLVGLMALALIFSLSRSGILAFFIGLAVFLLLAPRKNKWLLPLSLGIMGLVVFIYGYRLGFAHLIQRFFQIETSGQRRLDIWEDAWRMLKDHPLGIGLGNFSVLYPWYQVRVTAPVKYSHAHNDFLQVAIEAGLPAWFFLVGGFLCFMVLTIRRLHRLDPDQDEFAYFIAVGGLSGLAALFVHSIFDFSLQIPSNAFYAATLLVLAQAPFRPQPADLLRPRHNNAPKRK
jgi:O-antigen ligase